MDYYLNRKNYEIAEEIGTKIIRKRSLKGSLDNNFMKTIAVKWANAMTLLIEQEVTIAQKEWNSSKSFYFINRTILDKSAFRCKRVQALLQLSLLEELNTSKKWNKLVSSLMPYPIETGYIENDANPEFGPLVFNCSGGFALDYHLRSIGANLGGKKRVVAIRLQRWAEKTRVRPENLSVWISDDNKVYRRYTGSVSFSNETGATLLDRLDFSCRFLKIHSDFEDDKYTFAEDFKRILEIYGPPDFD